MVKPEYMNPCKVHVICFSIGRIICNNMPIQGVLSFRIRKVQNITATETYNIFFSISMASNCDLSQYEGKQIKSDKVITLSNLQNFLSRKEQKKRIVIKYLVPASIYVRRRMIMVLNCHNSKKSFSYPLSVYREYFLSYLLYS